MRPLAEVRSDHRFKEIVDVDDEGHRAWGLVVVGRANADVLCKARIGTVKIRVACKPSESLVDPIALGLQGPPGPSPATASVRVFQLLSHHSRKQLRRHSDF